MPRILFFIASLFFTVNAIAEKAPTFNLPSDQGQVSLEKLGKKLVYVDFWATWCTPCRKSFPWMNEMQKKYADKGFQIVAINLDNKRERAHTFLKKYPADFTIVYDPEGKTADDYKVKVMPSSYFVDAKGNLVGKHYGFRDSDKAKLEEEIRKLLGI